MHCMCYKPKRGPRSSIYNEGDCDIVFSTVTDLSVFHKIGSVSELHLHRNSKTLHMRPIWQAKVLHTWLGTIKNLAPKNIRFHIHVFRQRSPVF